MDVHGPNDFAIPIPILPLGIANYNGIPRSSWVTRSVALRNEGGEDVANAICRSVDANLVINMDGTPLGIDRGAIQIVESLCEEEVPSA